MDKADWDAIWDYAGVLKTSYGVQAPVGGILGRSITFIVDKLVQFWDDHKATLIPFLSQAAIAALQALVAAQADIAVVNQEGPR